ncbi:MAG: PAS domain-containing sensor histidine kinase [bacterium]|nr:PAS domain-containing sensor histidine kinase [bacterium]
MKRKHETRIIKAGTDAAAKAGGLLLNELAYVVNKTPICIKLFDETGRLRFINQHGAEEHFLRTAEEIRDWDYLSSVDSEFIEEVKAAMLAAFKGEAREVEFKHAPGTSANEWCQGYILPLKNNSGKTIGVLFSSLDATGRKKAVEKIEKLEKAKNEFISIAAHQLQTPIAALRGYSSLLLDNKEKFVPEHQESIAAIAQAASNMSDLVNFLLKIVRAEGDAVKFNLAPVDLLEITQEVVRLLRPEINAKSQRVEISKHPDIFPKVITNHEAVKQVVQNLLSNAVRYSPPKSVIHVLLSLVNDEAQYSVKDQGIGIPKNEQSKIFEKFYRASNAKAEVPYGTGLGLSLTKSFVEACGGKIWFESEENGGTVFYITLPIVEKRKAGIETK